MKKYILFGFDQYYPRGGMFDKFDSYDSLEEAKADTDIHHFDCIQVVDRDTWEVVWENYDYKIK